MMLSKTKGFTLIELLISLVILGSLITLSGYAYSTYLDRWKENLGGFNEMVTDVRSRMLVNQALQSIYPYIVVSGSDEKISPFFFGEEKLVEGVVGTGVFNNANAAIFKLELKGDSLVYFERSTADVLLTSSDESFTYNRKLILTTDVTEVQYRYYGWPSYNDRLKFLSGNARDNRRWFSEYLARDTGLLPEKIELTISSTELGETRLVYDVPNGIDVILKRYFANEARATDGY